MTLNTLCLYCFKLNRMSKRIRKRSHSALLMSLRRGLCAKCLLTGWGGVGSGVNWIGMWSWTHFTCSVSWDKLTWLQAILTPPTKKQTDKTNKTKTTIYKTTQSINQSFLQWDVTSLWGSLSNTFCGPMSCSAKLHMMSNELWLFPNMGAADCRSRVCVCVCESLSVQDGFWRLLVV